MCLNSHSIVNIRLLVYDRSMSHRNHKNKNGGSVDFNGKTRRERFDFSGRYQPIPSLYFDADVNYAHGRAVGVGKGQDYIPLASG